MSLQLHFVNLALRLFEKPYLARVQDPAEARARLAQLAEIWFVRPAGASYQEARLGKIRALEASQGRVDRRRILVWFHGGAYFQGSPETHRHLGAALSGLTGARVLLPDYRLAPEHPFPAAIEDALASWRALMEAGYDPARIAVGGDSAGGGLAFGLLHLLQEQGLAVPACLIAFSPWVDLTLSGASLERNALADVMVPASRMAEVRDRYLAGADPADPRASPVFGRFRDPPPALIQASRAEILEDDATALAHRLTEAGGQVRLEFWRDTPHAWQLFQGWLPEADAALDAAGAFLRRHLGGEEAAGLDPGAEAQPAYS
ncbi:MAG TPA: alpha/beta hydrolase [Paracoccaceae bacterium]|nr:alpha/beta hydrolase [Paracoccaceae bacterium]